MTVLGLCNSGIRQFRSKCSELNMLMSSVFRSPRHQEDTCQWEIGSKASASRCRARWRSWCTGRTCCKYHSCGLSTRIPPPLLELLDPVQDLGVGVGLEVLVVPAGVPGVARVEPDGPQPAVRDHGARLGHVVPHHLITGSLVELQTTHWFSQLRRRSLILTHGKRHEIVHPLW